MTKRIKYKGLSEFADWCKLNPEDGMTVEDIALTYLNFDLSAIKSNVVRKWWKQKISAQISKLKKKVEYNNDHPFISAKTINGVSVYGDLSSNDHDVDYTRRTRRIVRGIEANHTKLMLRKAMIAVVTATEKKKKAQEVMASG